MYWMRESVEEYTAFRALSLWHIGYTGVRVGQGYGWLGYFVK